MKNVMIVLLASIVLCGCDGFRFAASQEQKQNAWLHWRTTELAAQKAAEEKTSTDLQGLTGLSAQQSQAFVADYGMPDQLPKGLQAGLEIAAQPGAAVPHLSEGLAVEKAIAQMAYRQSMERPDVWVMADGAIDLGIGIAGLLGGVYGIRATQFFKQAREKSKALKEIIEGNELFKETNPLQAQAFKEAQKEQSAETRKIVTETKVQL